MAGKLTKKQLTSHMEAFHGHPRQYGQPYSEFNTAQFRELHEGDHVPGAHGYHEHTNLTGKTTLGKTVLKPGFSHGGMSTMDVLTDRRNPNAASSERNQDQQRRTTPLMDRIAQQVAQGH